MSLRHYIEDAIVKVEVLSAKGAMYDEVAANTDRVNAALAKADKDKAVAEANLKWFEQGLGPARPADSTECKTLDDNGMYGQVRSSDAH